jgi:hypothetical protein
VGSVSAAEIAVLAVGLLLLLAMVLVLDRVIKRVAAAIASVLDLIRDLVSLALGLVGFAVRIRRIVFRLIVTPLIGPSR